MRPPERPHVHEVGRILRRDLRWKDYRREAERLRTSIQAHARRPVETLLDVACGTGQHLVHLKPHYAVEGLDLNPEILAIARRRHPDVVFHQADMVRFDLPRRFDVVTCLFASVAYAGTVAKDSRENN
ncbi:MAG TPA: class I SAM-dependent methyltransferase [bacterium]|nr:class I SAM-dependent methyltransferase [bacterium]